jgi:hypothetical protein
MTCYGFLNHRMCSVLKWALVVVPILFILRIAARAIAAGVTTLSRNCNISSEESLCGVKSEDGEGVASNIAYTRGSMTDMASKVRFWERFYIAPLVVLKVNLRRTLRNLSLPDYPGGSA